jgi:integrase
MASQLRQTTKVTGVYRIHARDCKFGREVLAYRERHKDAGGKHTVSVDEAIAAVGGQCRCEPNFQATVYSARDRKLIRKHCGKLKDAESWRTKLRGAVEDGKVRAPAKITVAEAAKVLLERIADGTAMNRSGRPYKAATQRRYELALRVHVLPSLGHVRLSSVDRSDIKALVRGWIRAGMAPSSIRNNLDPLRVIFREAIEDGQITVDPLARMQLPQGGGRRERVADRAEAQALIDALPESERALWACAFYGGLRRGELRALRWSDIDFDVGEIHVKRGWDDKGGEQATKSDAGERDVPLAGILRKMLAAHKLASGRGGDELVFGRTGALPFVPSTIGERSRRAWGWRKKPNPELAKNPDAKPKEIWVKAREDALEPIVLHESRHSAASYGIEMGLNDLELTAMIGHSDVRTTKNIYGHLFADSSAAVRAKMDAYHEGGGSRAAG